jgi:hypothetical protein
LSQISTIHRVTCTRYVRRPFTGKKGNYTGYLPGLTYPSHGNSRQCVLLQDLLQGPGKRGINKSQISEMFEGKRNPGAKQFIRIPSGPYVAASARVNPSTACFDITYGARFILPLVPRIEDKFTIDPRTLGTVITGIHS